jgi:para-aminobenzoate synthetase/4-amino-4-deoxychorismate lyase
VFDPSVLLRPGTVLLDTARDDPEATGSWCYVAPRRTLTASTADEVRPLFRELQAETRAGRYVAGFASYEAGLACVGLDLEVAPEGPLAWFGVYDRRHRLAPADVDAGLAMLDGSASVTDARLDVDREAYRERLRRVRHHIREGDVYQVNVTAPLRFRAEGDPRLLFRRLRARQRVPYGAYLNVPTGTGAPMQILSCSPELFVRRAGERVVTRPMKGTIRRGRTLEEDRALRDRLAADPKNRAENLMIVDLLRNDLSVCCRPGTVEVPDLFTTEPYDTVTQMTSTVEGRLQEGAGLSDLLDALFPCGSITGAPKRRAMRIIRSIETHPRGVYCGAIGHAGPRTAAFSVAIRTAVLREGRGTMGIGSGVVWDSDPEDEYEECLLKARFLTEPPTHDPSADPAGPRLIETMRHDGEAIPLLGRHVERLARSAAYFNYPFDEARFRRRVRRAVPAERATGGAGRPAGDERSRGGGWKVRATLDRWGRLRVGAARLGAPRPEPWALVLADEPVDPDDVRLHHKTTDRGLYDRAYAAAERAGADEAILHTRAGDVTEGTFTNVFARFGDAWYTPPTECGLLGGVYRRHVLNSVPAAQTRALTVDDLRRADALACCNAVRGWCRARLVEAPGAAGSVPALQEGGRGGAGKNGEQATTRAPTRAPNRRAPGGV